MAKILPVDEQTIFLCADELKKGNLVAFPTETVYGLGANALNSFAVEKIFEAKKRPKSDPLIVHVSKIEDAYNLIDATPFQKTCFEILGKKFWPGPLTIIVKCSNQVPKNVTANSHYVGIRIPNHPVALELLEKCGFPVAAPSANLFGHTSPTTAEHVATDLGYYQDLIILQTDVPCHVGIESTIIKIDENNEITLLRPGAISSIEISEHIKFNVKHKKRELTEKNMGELESSGQLLTHYAPSLESFILGNLNKGYVKEINFLSQCVLIDFNSIHKDMKKIVTAYFDLSSLGSFAEASYNLFAILRNAEAVNGAKYILLPDFSNFNDELAIAVFDRVYRAASGKYISLNQFSF
ncbi:MAG: L-threonylcarbamoyladenylate synthase [Bdellovibrionota bacterium]